MATIYNDQPIATNLEQQQKSTYINQATAIDLQHKPVATNSRKQQSNIWLSLWLVFDNKICHLVANIHPPLFHNLVCRCRPKKAGNLRKALRQFWKSGSLSTVEKEKGTKQILELDKEVKTKKAVRQKKIWRMEVQVIFLILPLILLLLIPVPSVL